jgi:hypothetical protein
MEQRTLLQFLKNGLVDLGGDDTRLEKVLATSDAVADHLQKTPSDIVPFLYSALDANSPDDDIAIKLSQELLANEWITYANVFSGTPILLLRSIILDAIITVANKDVAVENLIAIAIAGTIPNIDLGSEADLWTEALLDIQQQVERRAEQEWSVPSRIAIPKFDLGEHKPIKVPKKRQPIGLEELEKGLAAAVGPTNRQGQPTGGNPQWSNAAQPWANEFVPRAAEAIKSAIDQGSKVDVGPIDASEFFGDVSVTVSGHIDTVLTNVAAATQGLELRSRLLWWKEALYSTSSQVSYRTLESPVASGLMPYDFQILLPSLTPASVTMFLRETVTSLVGSNAKKQYTLNELLEKLKSSNYTKPLRAFVSGLEMGEGRQPVVMCLRDGIDLDLAIEETTIFDPNHKLTLAEMSTLVFLELQTMKAVNEIKPKKARRKKK